MLKLSPQHYDVIVAEPSNPWTVGIGSVFSREYYELAASRLKPGGIMAQWFHVYEWFLISRNGQVVWDGQYHAAAGISSAAARAARS